MEAKYIITRSENHYYINKIKIPNKVFREEMVNYQIEDRECLLDNLFMWITEARTDKQLMKDDVKLLINLDDEYILSSMSTNHYLYGNSDEFNQRCEEILSKV